MMLINWSIFLVEFLVLFWRLMLQLDADVGGVLETVHLKNQG